MKKKTNARKLTSVESVIPKAVPKKSRKPPVIDVRCPQVVIEIFVEVTQDGKGTGIGSVKDKDGRSMKLIIPEIDFEKVGIAKWISDRMREYKKDVEKGK